MTRRRVTPLALLLVFLVVGLLTPRLAGAVPPGGIRIFSGGSPVPGPAGVQFGISNSHDIVAESSVMSVTQRGGSITNWDGVSGRGIDRFAGQDMAITIWIWLVDGVTLPLAGSEIMQFIQFPHSGVATLTPTGGFGSIRNAAGGYDNLVPADFNDPETGLPGRRISKATAVGKSGDDTADIVLSLNFGNLPDPSALGLSGDATFSFSAKTFVNNGGYTKIYERPGSFILKTKTSKVDVQTGDIYSGNIPKGRLLPQSQQAIVTADTRDIRSCDDLVTAVLRNECNQDGSLAFLGRHTLNADSSANATTARQELKRSLSKAAQKVALISPPTDSSSAISGVLKGWLATPENALLKPRGRMLVVRANTTGANITLDGSGDTFLVSGKAVVVFVGFARVEWLDNVQYDHNNTDSALVSFVLGGNQVLNGRTGGCGSGLGACFDGGYGALSLNRPGGHTLFVSGSGEPTGIYGWLIGDNINFDRQPSTPNGKIAVINYDRRFQDGILLGLSPFIRPLVSE